MSESERETIPQQLRAARRAKGVELEDVHRKTGVSLPVLQGLEAGKYDVVEPVFARMAFGAYVDYLGLEKDALLAQYDALQGPAKPSVAVAEPAVAAPAAELSSVLDSSAVRMVGLAAGALVILLIAISLLDGDGEPAGVDRAARATVEVPVAQKSAPSAAESTAPIAAQSTSAAPANSAALAPADAMPEIPAALEEVAAEVESVPQGREEQAAAVVSSAATEAAAPSANSATESAVAEGVLDSLSEPAAEAPSGEVVAVSDEAVVDAAASERESPATGGTAALATELAADPVEVVAAAADEVALLDAATAAAEIAATGSENGLLLLEVEAVDSTWVQINWDEAGYFQGIVPRGESRRWQAREFFRVHSGRAHGLRYKFQGELLGDGALGEATRVLRFLATAEGVSLLDADLKPLETAAQP